MIETSTTRQRDQDRRIDQRRDRLALHRRDDLGVLDVAPQDRVEVAAALAGQQRRACRRAETGRRARRTRRTAPCPTAPSRGRRRAPPGTPATSTRRFSRSSDWTSGMPALSSVASSWLKTRNSRVLIAPPLRQAAARRRRRRPSAAARGRTALSPRARGADGLRCRRRTRLRRFPRSATRAGSGIPRSRP